MRKLVVYLIVSIFFFVVSSKAHGIENPLSVPNNKFGVHILFPSELADAGKLVNSNGGKWGYVTIPIQAGDRDLVKWQKFMDAAKQYSVIPIIRIATENSYFNTRVWRKPKYADVLDFANFLNSLNWPTKNRYVIVFNEVNRSDEWGGSTNPQEYAEILAYAAEVFKARSEDFFIIAAGLDNASANASGVSFEPHTFLGAMERAIPGVFTKIDGLASHSYPNPSFAKPPSERGKVSVASFRFERELVKNLSGRDLPIFITETGWSEEFVPDHLASSYFTQAFTSVWSSQEVVAVTPFLLSANAGAFTPFSLLRGDGLPTTKYLAIRGIQKVLGQPSLATAILGERTERVNSQTLDFSQRKLLRKRSGISTTTFFLTLFKWVMKI